MSIVPLKKVTLFALHGDKRHLLQDLQRMGWMELIPLGPPGSEKPDEPPEEAWFHFDCPVHPGQKRCFCCIEAALEFLRTCPHRRRQIRDPAGFDPETVVRRVLQVRQRLHELETERDALIERLKLWQPWGDFEFAPLEAMDGWRLWFYVVPHAELPRIQALPYYQEVVRRDQRFCYVVLIAREEPKNVPVPRVHLGARSRRQLQTRLDAVELAIEDAQAERAWLTRWYTLLRRSLATLRDHAALEEAARHLLARDPLIAVQGWIPKEREADIRRYAETNRLAVQAESPGDDDRPPTLLRNPSWLQAGEDLVNFYMTPGYHTWDPSAVVFFSFALFFAMILADAGYAALLGLGLGLGWRRLGDHPLGRRYRPLALTIVAFSLIYGVLTGGYFGLPPPPDSLPSRLHWLSFDETERMMGVSVLIGSLHLILACVMDARRHSRPVQALASIGWALVFTAGLMLVLEEGFGLPLPHRLAIVSAGSGLALVLVCSAPDQPFPRRLWPGLKALTQVTTAFGDVLSYLRLFALGLASGSLAVQFNQMALDLTGHLPGIGLAIALLVLALGHGVNLTLGVAGGVIHGLRLNVIEFFKWGLKEEGRLFRPLKRTEIQEAHPWTP